MRPRRGWLVGLLLCLLLSQATLSHHFGEETIRGFEVLLRYRAPQGEETTRRVTDFHFVYYERRFIRKSTGFGKPAKMEVRDVPHETTSVQNELLQKWKFKKLARIRLEYREEEGKRVLFLVATPLKGKKPEPAWPAYDLRNASVARPPHFRGTVDGEALEVPLPPILEPDSSPQPNLTAIEFQFPGQKKRRDWF